MDVILGTNGLHWGQIDRGERVDPFGLRFGQFERICPRTFKHEEVNWGRNSVQNLRKFSKNECEILEKNW